MKKAVWTIGMTVAILAIVIHLHGEGTSAEDRMLQLLSPDRPYQAVPADVFGQLGWDLPDGGSSVKALANAAPGGAFDPRQLEKIPSNKLGYRAKWQEEKYKVYGLDWEIGGLQLTPNQPVAGLPTLVIVHGGSANWYEFYVDLFNNAGLGQYLAQKVPVMLITIPGNFKFGGWTEHSFDKRVPAYLLHTEISEKEGKIRNSVFTFRVVVEGVRRLIEKNTTGPVVVIGHSTGGEIPYLLEGTSLKPRLNGMFLGWGSGGPAGLDKKMRTEEGVPPQSTRSLLRYSDVANLRGRWPDGDHDETYVKSKYIGPLNPCKGSDAAEVARCWFRQEERRRPQFKQELQDAEHTAGVDAARDSIEKGIRAALADNEYGVKPDEVVADLFSTNNSPVTGYKKMLWMAGRLDNGHWNDKDPDRAGDLRVANQFRKLNPQATIRVAFFDLPMTHYGHIEKPRQLAGAMVAALKWLVQ